jgi:hypothetical protein
VGERCALLALDVLASISQFSTANPVVVLFSLILSGWFLFSRAVRQILADLAELDIAIIRHIGRRREEIAKLPPRSTSRTLGTSGIHQDSP